MNNDLLTSSMGWYPAGNEINWLENKRQVAPFFTVAAKNPKELVDSLLSQNNQDWNITTWTDFDGLTDFSRSVSQYCLLVLNNELFIKAAKDSKFLNRLMLILLRYDLAAARLGYQDEGMVGVAFSRRHFIGRNKFIKYGNLVHDLYKFYESVSSNLGVVYLNNSKGAPTDWYEPTHSEAIGWRSGPNGKRTNQELLALLSVPPNQVISMDLKSPLWTCLNNEWYDHGRILRGYVGLKAELQIPGKFQHGWQTETGLDGEQGYKDEVRGGKTSVYIWNRRNLENCEREGITQAEPVGAPFIYRDDGPDPSCAENKLLAIPFHSVPEYIIYSDWRSYASKLLVMSKERGFSGLTICLHYFDYKNEEVVKAIRGVGVDVVCLGDPMTRRFMDRCVNLIRYHAAVVSDRVCSAGLYSMMLDRPFFVYGEVLECPDPLVGLGVNKSWLKKNMASVLEFTGKVDKDLAERELGLEFKKSKQELQDLLWGHCL